MIKSEIRKIYLQKRIALSETECDHYSHQISDLLFSGFDIASIKILHTYLPIEKNKEPNTWLIIDRIKQEFSGVQISIPKIRNNNLENFYFESNNQLEKNSWGISEPLHGVSTPIEKIDMVLVPLLAFDKSGNRVGYGKGFYDRFLKGCRPDCKKVGLSFFDAVEQIDDIDIHDIRLDACITPSELIFF